MQKTKAIVALIITSVLLISATGIAISQFVSAATSKDTTQSSQGSISSYGNTNQEYCPYGMQYSSQNGAPYDYGHRMGMCRQFW